MVIGGSDVLRIVFFLMMYIQCIGQSLHFKNYQLSDGLPSSYILDLEIGADGALWILSHGGQLTRYDGRSFRSYNDFGGVEQTLRCLLVDKMGTIYAAGDSVLIGLNRLKKSKLISDFGVVSDVLKLNSGLILVASDRGVLSVREGADVQEEFTDSTAIKKLLNTSDGTVLAISDHGVFERRSRGRWHKVLSYADDRFIDMAEDSNGTIWILAGDGSLYILRGQDLLRQPDFSQEHIHATVLRIGDMGSLLVGTERHGIYVINTIDGLTKKLIPDRLENNRIVDLRFDDWGQGWIATYGGGLIQFNAANYTLYDEDDMSGRGIDRIVEHDKNKSVVIYRDGSADIFDGYYFEKIQVPGGNSTRIWDVVEWGDQSLVVTNSGWYRGNELLFENVWGDRIWQVISHKQNQFLVLADQSLYQLMVDESDTLKVDFKKLCSTSHRKMILEDQKVYLWSNQGVSVYSMLDSSLTTLTQSIEIQQVVSGRGAVYVLSRNEGVYEIVVNAEDAELKKITFRENVFLSPLVSAASDKEYLWIMDIQGRLIRLLDSVDSNNDVITYDFTEDLDDVRFLPGVAMSLQKGMVVFGTQQGIFSYTSSGTEVSMAPRLSSVGIFTSTDTTYLSMDNSPTVTIDPGIPVQLKFEAVDLQSDDALAYQWSMDEDASVWNSLQQGSLELAGLSPGQHLVSVRAGNSRGNYTVAYSFTIQVPPPWWRNSWVLASALLLFMAAIYFFYRWRMNRVIQLSHQKAQALETQNELLRLEQSALQLQMNPHFLFNALQSIQHSILTGEKDSARRDLQRFSKLMRSMLEQSRQKSILLEDEMEGLKLYLETERMLRPDRFDFELNIDPELDPSFLKIPPMLIQPFVENAIKHGVPHDRKGMITVSFQPRGRHLSCVVSDNGPGWGEKVSQHKSAGLDVTRSRLRSYFDSDRNDLLIFEERKDADGKVQGLTVHILVPVLDE